MVEVKTVKGVYFVEGISPKDGHKPYRRLDVVLSTLDGGQKKFSAFLKEDQKRLCGLSDPDYVGNK